ncbi:MAG: cupin domain-containing protein [Phycisphaerales bacterium]|nr:cupin domain-containing protein [Phycisphaerales bacterium]
MSNAHHHALPDSYSAEEICRALELQPHPEGGFYRETWRESASGGARGAGTAIYFLLSSGVINRWHRVDAAEIWHFYAGAPLLLSIAREGEAAYSQTLGNAIMQGERPQLEVPANAWQRAQTLGAWTLVGCTVSPAFLFDKLEIARDGDIDGSALNRSGLSELQQS